MTKFNKEELLNVYQVFLGQPAKKTLGLTILKNVCNELDIVISKSLRSKKKPQRIQEIQGSLDGDLNNKRPSPYKSN